MNIILKYIVALLIITSTVNAKEENCQVGQGKDAFISCMVTKANKTNKIEDINLIAAIYVVDKQYEEGIKWYKKSAEQGDAKAAFFLGGIYDEALGIESDKFSDKVKTYLLGKDKTLLSNQKEAIKWYKKAAKADYDDAMPHMNEMMEKVYGKEDTVKLYQKEIKEGKDVYWNKRFLANFYFRIDEYEKREATYKELMTEYPKEKADWLFAIGNAYDKRFLNNKELEYKYYEESAELGNVEAMRNIGIHYGEKKDYKTAEMWFRKAGHNSMVCYMYKKLVRDKDKTLECYKKEAESGELDAIGILAQTYQIEYKEYDKAIEWYKKVYELGDSGGALNIAVMYKYSLKREDNAKEKMMYWYKKAASMGNLKAIKFLNKKGKL